MLQRRVIEYNKEITCIIEYLDKAKITKPIQPSRSDNSGPTEILPSKNQNEAVDTKHQFSLEEIVVPARDA